MKLVDSIKENDINQGDLVFIVHLEKTWKTGWWRKVRYKDATKNDLTTYGNVVYVLEIPIHKDFVKYSLEDCNTRKENGVYIMKSETLKHLNDADTKYGSVKPYGESKYIISACFKCVAGANMSLFLRNNKESLPTMKYIWQITDGDNRSLITKEFKRICDLYNRENEDVIANIVSNLE